MVTTNIDSIRVLLKGIETGDPAAVNVINPDKYIQHNPQTYEGRDGLAELFGRLSKSNPRVNIVRAFQDGDYVFAHTEYDFSTRRIGFEVFRFEDGMAVEHWDNIQPREGPNASGRSMVDGPTVATDLDLTDVNRDLVRAFSETVLVAGHVDRIEDYVDSTNLAQHDPRIEDGLEAFRSALVAKSDPATKSNLGRAIQFDRVHRVLAQGNFALAVSEGTRHGVHSAFYDLYRVSSGRIVEHWNTIEAVAPQSDWKNANGKF